MNAPAPTTLNTISTSAQQAIDSHAFSCAASSLRVHQYYSIQQKSESWEKLLKVLHQFVGLIPGQYSGKISSSRSFALIFNIPCTDHLFQLFQTTQDGRLVSWWTRISQFMWMQCRARIKCVSQTWLGSMSCTSNYSFAQRMASSEVLLRQNERNWSWAIEKTRILYIKRAIWWTSEMFSNYCIIYMHKAFIYDNFQGRSSTACSIVKVSEVKSSEFHHICMFVDSSIAA